MYKDTILEIIRLLNVLHSDIANNKSINKLTRLHYKSIIKELRERIRNEFKMLK